MNVGENGDLVRCSFCGKTPKQVDKLIAGPGVYICNECIDLCNDIIEDEGLEVAEVPEATVPPLTVDQREWSEARRVLAERLGRDPTVSELAAVLGWTRDRVTAAGRAAAGAQRQRARQVAHQAKQAGGNVSHEDEFVNEVKREFSGSLDALELLAETLTGAEDRLVVDRLALRVATEAERLARRMDRLRGA